MQYMRSTLMFLLIGIVVPFAALSQEESSPEMGTQEMGTQEVETQEVEVQEKLVPEEHTLQKQVFVSPEGEVYIWSQAPIYISFSTSLDDSSKRYLLLNKKSLRTTKEPIPFTLEGHGRHNLVHPADHKNLQRTADVNIFPINEDSKGPVAEISVAAIAGADGGQVSTSRLPMVVRGDNIIYGRPIELSLNFKDKNSGLQSSFFSLNGEYSQSYEAPFSLEAEGDYHLKYYAFDNVGNKSNLYKRYYSLDFTPPDSQIEVVGTYVEDILSPKSKIIIRSKDEKAGVKTIYYNLPENRSRAVYKKPLSMAGYKDGEYTLLYSAIDRVANQESDKRYSFYLDSVPPVVTYGLVGDQYVSRRRTYVSERTTVTLSATDNKAGVRRIRYFLGSKSGHVYSEPFNFIKKNGPATVSYQASDNVTNISTKKSKKVIVDISAPTIKLAFKGEHYYSRKTHYIRRNTSILYVTKDNLSGVKSIEYTLDDSTPIAAAGKFTVAEEGRHTINAKVIDNVQNEFNKKFFIFVDETPPELFPRLGVTPTEPGEADGNGAVYPTKTRFYLSATDDQSGMKKIQYRVNSGSLKLYKSALTFPNVGTYKVEVVGTDNVGNVSRKSITFKTRKY